MFHFEKNFGLYVGKLITNEYHQHYALQISIAKSPSMKLRIKGEDEIVGDAFYIASKINHKLTCSENHLTLLINPLSSLGHQLFLNFGTVESKPMNNSFSKSIRSLLFQLDSEEINFNTFLRGVKDQLNLLKCSCENENHCEDDRVIKALEIMDANFDRVYKLEEIADLCHLSPSRFLHLFKEKTKLNFRRYQLWNRLLKSLSFLLDKSITETAHTFGFTDSSHYNRTFKETFGVNPKFIVRKD